MNFLPNDYHGSWTLAGSVVRKGVGLHRGEEGQVRLSPSDKPGFHVYWKDSHERPFTININQALDSQLCTTLEFGHRRLSTVEHLLAALAGCGLTHVELEVFGEEIPLLDGSSLCWVEAIGEAGLKPAKTPRLELPDFKRPLIFNRGNSVITATPAEKFTLVGMIDFPSYPVIGKQMLRIELTPQKFVQEIAPARTFGFLNQLEQLRDAGLIKGGSLENALICDTHKWINPPLRFQDEPIRHKILDLIGDLALVGFPKAQIIVYKGSHGLHTDLAAALIQ